MEPAYISELRAEIKSELQNFNNEHTLRKISSIFTNYKFVLSELIIATVAISEIFYGVNNTLLGGFSSIFFASMIALLILVPINATFSAVHYYFYKKKWKSSEIKSKAMSLIDSELEEFNGNLSLDNNEVSIPSSNFLSSLAYFSPEYLLFGPRNEMIQVTLNHMTTKISTSQDYSGVEGRLLVISLITDEATVVKNNFQCEVSYQEKEYIVYATTKEISDCLNTPELKNFIVSFFELFSLRSQGWIKVAKHNISKDKAQIKIDIIINDYLPLAASLYGQLKKYLIFYGKSFLDILKFGCIEKT